MKNLSLVFFIIFLMPVKVFGQSSKGVVMDKATTSVLPYVNIGVVGKNTGTVSDINGNFEINLDKVHDSDTLRFSMIGYNSKDFQVSEFRHSYSPDSGNIYLVPKITILDEVTITSSGSKSIVLGNKPKSRFVNAGFIYNNLGHEIGSLITIDNLTLTLDSVQLNFAKCNYEKVYFRLNIYQVSNGKRENILSEPIYASLTKQEVLNRPIINLTSYNLTIDNDFIVSVEIVKNLGEMGLYFFADLDGKNSPTVYREISQSNWGFVNHKSKSVGISILTYAH